MVSFELGEELRKMFFRLDTNVGQRKILNLHEESNLRPLDLRSDALPLSHKDSIRFLMGTQNFFFVPQEKREIERKQKLICRLVVQ